MKLDEHLLSVRLTIIMGKYKYDFTTSTEDYKQKLKEEFNYNYSNNEIIKGLHEIETAYMEDLYQKERQIIELEEDY